MEASEENVGLFPSVAWLQEWEICVLLSEQGPASSLNCPAIDILEFLTTENELQLLTMQREGHLFPQYNC